MPKPNRVNVNSGARPIAETLVQLIDSGLHVLRQDAADLTDGFLVDELFSFYGTDVASAVKKYLIDHENIPVVLNWPREGLGIPQVSVVTASEEENTSLDWLGDRGSYLGTGFFSQGLDADGDPALVGEGPIVQRDQKGYAEDINISIFVRADAATPAVYLSNLVRLIVFMNKTSLIDYLDFHNLVIGVSDIANNPELFPEFAYTRQITLKGNTYFDFNLPQKVIEALDFALLVRPQVITDDPDAVITPAIEVPYSR